MVIYINYCRKQIKMEKKITNSVNIIKLFCFSCLSFLWRKKVQVYPTRVPGVKSMIFFSHFGSLLMFYHIRRIWFTLIIVENKSKKKITNSVNIIKLFCFSCLSFLWRKKVQVYPTRVPGVKSMIFFSHFGSLLMFYHIRRISNSQLWLYLKNDAVSMKLKVSCCKSKRNLSPLHIQAVNEGHRVG